MRHFEIMGSMQEEGKSWRSNLNCHVVAENAQKALELALEKYPSLDVWSLHHKGRVDIIEQIV